MKKILIIDDDVASCRTLQLHFLSEDFEVQIAHNVEDGLVAGQILKPDVIILDIKMPGRSGLEGLPDFKENHPDTPIIMITAFQDMNSTIEAMQLGATEYIHKPIDINELNDAVNNALNRNEAMKNDLEIAPRDQTDKSSMVGRSRMMKEVFKTIGLVASQPVTVLITGESGTGKELTARAIHNASDRSDGTFVAINCAALVETLLESDMFGHEKGSFTGAVGRQLGKFELANNGTIFLDELGELPQTIQAKLLRVLQEKEFTPVGSSISKKTNARVIAATNVNLEEKVKIGAFREDLFYRLRVVTIEMPPLRERTEDIMPLVQVLLGNINKELKRNISRLSQSTMTAFLNYDWPGNVRELNNILTKAVALCPGEMITPDLIPEEISSITSTTEPGSSYPTAKEDSGSQLLSLNDLEKQHVIRVLQETDWHKGKACEILGVSRPRLRRMMQHFKIQKP
ncbi:MAG TPA: sigma-54-dependent Fis family transcriptional regulator [Leucothrix sp.]|nr:sigma-54-dependent Fis family transcriptional regulator [Leucothrix sp.]